MTSGEALKYKRLLVKISGEALMGKGGYGLDTSVLERRPEARPARRMPSVSRNSVKVVRSTCAYSALKVAVALTACPSGAIR